MLRRCPILFALLWLPTAASAQEIDRAKLRGAAQMPTVFIEIPGIDPETVDELGRPIDHAQALGAILTRLKTQPLDAEAWLEAAGHLDKLDNPRARTEAVANAQRILETHRDTTDPRHGKLLSAYAAYLKLDGQPSAEVERWARRAVEIAPQDWRCWSCLGELLGEAALASAAQDMPGYKTPPTRNDRYQMANKLSERRRLPDDWRKVSERLDEANECWRRARELAPREPLRIGAERWYRLVEHPLRWAMQRDRGVPTAPNTPAASPEIVQAIHDLADLQIHDVREQVEGVLLMLTTRRARPLLADDHAVLAKYTKRLEAAARHPDGAARAYAQAALANACGAFDDWKAAEQHARQSLDLDPKQRLTWLILEHAVKSQGRAAEALAISARRVQLDPTAWNCFLTAKQHWKHQDYAGADRYLRQGLALDPRHPLCLVSMAALRLREAEQPAALDEAERLLAQAKAVLPAEETNLQSAWRACDLIRRGLRGADADGLRAELRELAKKHPRDEALPDVAAALGVTWSRSSVDRDALRNLIVPPDPQMQAGFFFNGAERGIDGRRHDPKKEIARLQAELRGTPDDAPVLWKLANQFDATDKETAAKHRARAAELFPTLLAQQPQHVHHHLDYAWLLTSLQRSDEAAAQVRLARARGGDQWRCQLGLAGWAFMEATRHLCTPEQNTWTCETIAHRALLDPEMARRVDAFERSLREGQAFFDRAVALAPEEPEVWYQRSGFRWGTQSGQALARAARGIPPFADNGAMEMMAAMRADLRELARLRPDNPIFVGGAGMCAVMTALASAKPGIAPPDPRHLTQELEQYAATLEKIAAAGDADLAPHAHAFAAKLYLFLGVPAKALPHARRGLDAMPDDLEAWGLLDSALRGVMCFQEARTHNERCVQRLPTAAHYYRLGHCCCVMKDYEAAARHFRAGLEKDAKHANCLLGMAAVALARGDDAALDEADNWLREASLSADAAKNADLRFLTGCSHALRGSPLLAQVYFRQAIEVNPKCFAFAMALGAVQP